MSETVNPYPDRYYARYDHTASQPAPVTGWFDTQTLSTTANLPEASLMVPMTAEQWDGRLSGPQFVSEGALVAYTPPPVLAPLKDQAALQQPWIASQATLAAAMGETFTDTMKAYVKAIQALASGADTTTTALPTRPDAPYME